MCSTPYGIRGLDQLHLRPVLVLPISSAQRLTASEGWINFVNLATNTTFLGAQRLTASEGWISF